MKVTIGKEFEWQMSHRLTFHKGPCKNIHGHSYKMLLEMTGETDFNEMIMDYYDIERIVSPLIERLDHAFLVDEKDEIMLSFLEKQGFKLYKMPIVTTSEAMAKHFMSLLAPEFAKFEYIETLKIRIYETHDAYAEVQSNLR